MRKASTRGQSRTVKDICDAMESIAPIGLAQSWDNVGLIAGDATAAVRRVLLCIDLTESVVDEALAAKADLVLTYHPPIFKPVSSLRRPGFGMESVVFRCIREGIALYATHTALDAADGGTNDMLAALCDVTHTEPLEYVDEPGVNECKVTVFVPYAHVEQVADAMFAAGAGRIGEYTRCSFRLKGQGTFLGGETTKPAVGQRGRMETVDEIRLESVVLSRDLPAVVTAIRSAHPYEEPAFDIYPLKPRPVRGIGRIGQLRRLISLGHLARSLRRKVNASGIQMVGPPDRTVERAVIVAGSAGSLPFRVGLCQSDVIVTGEIRHHDALTILRHGATAIALGHWPSERPVLDSLAERLHETLPQLAVRISKSDRDPFQPI